LLYEAYPDAEVIVFGHTHEPLLVTLDVVVTVMNPGAPAGGGSISLRRSASWSSRPASAARAPRALYSAWTKTEIG
jgi:hypothetical protein